MRKKNHIDSIFKNGVLCCALVAGLLMLGFFVQLLLASFDTWKTFGLSFIIDSQWDPVANQFGALPSITGTLITTLLALLFALPLAFVSALYITDAPPTLARILSQCIDLLAAIPSVIYGMWGLFILCPIMQTYVQPFMSETLGLGHIILFGHTYNGFGFFTAGIILALMILPYICAVMRDVFQMTPIMLKESAYGLGCTRWETAKDIMIRYGIRGLLGGIFIGLGRALGETMAVLFVIGNVMHMPSGLFDSGTTIAATLANNFAEAEGLQRSALFALGLILLSMAFLIQIVAQSYLQKTSKQRGETC